MEISKIVTDGYETDDTMSDDSSPNNPTKYQLSPFRWLMLFLLSSVLFLSNVVCYTYAPIEHKADEYYREQDVSLFLTIYFLTYVLVAFPSSLIIYSKGLRFGVILACWFQALGAAIRVVPVFLETTEHTAFAIALSGQAIAAFAQPFFLNPAPQLAAAWFGVNERTLATTIAVCSNTLGIAGAYILIPNVFVANPSDIGMLLAFIAGAAAFLAVLCSLFFFGEPSAPPSASAMHNRNQQKEIAARLEQSNFSERLGLVTNLFQHKGFLHTVVAFGIAEATLNSVSSFMTFMLLPEGFPEWLVSAMGTAFPIGCIIGSTIMGWIVDRYHHYMPMMLICFFGSVSGLIIFSLLSTLEHPSIPLVAFSLISTSLFIGPIQPIAIEIAVECTYPSHESTISATQQVLGNLFSAALVPILSALRRPKTKRMDISNWVLTGLVTASALYFTTFTGEYKRLTLDKNHPYEAVEMNPRKSEQPSEGTGVDVDEATLIDVDDEEI